MLITTVKRIYPISENKQDAKHIMREVRLMRFLGRMCHGMAICAYAPAL